MNFYTLSYKERMKQLLLVMKLTTLFIILACFKVSATVAQTITLNAKNAPLSQVLKQIEKQSGYSIFYENNLLQDARKVSLNLNKAPLREALDKCFTDQLLTYDIVDNTIVIKKKDKPVVQKTKGLSAPPTDIRGKVTDEKGQPLSGVTIRIKKSARVVLTDNNGQFLITGVPDSSILVLSFVGYVSKEVPVYSSSQTLVVSLVPDVTSLKEVTVSTGYQDIPQERATGSFTKVDNELFNRRTSTNIIDRLEGVTSGLIFNKNYFSSDPNSSAISVRGLSTIYANTKPLIVVDNFPIDGDLTNINPNDVESVTVLKDAAASSIWGVRSGNGVIVITTKKGRLNKPLEVAFNSNYTYTAKPDIYYGKNFLNASDFIDGEQFLFSKGYYDATLNSTTTRPVVSPVVEWLAQQRSGTISASQATAQINALRSYDIRDDYSKYLYRSTGTQQYALNLSGGSDKATYYFSAGYDNVPSVLVGNSYNRIASNSSSTFKPFKNLEATAGLTYSVTNSTNNNPGNISTVSKSGYYPYARLADDNGNALALPKDYRYSYISNLGSSQLLDWTYKPLDDLNNADNTTKALYAKLNAGLKYMLIPGLSVEAKYQLEKQNSSTRNDQTQASYFTRNLINLNTQISGTAVTRPIPLGSILDQTRDELTGSSFRSQINFSHYFAGKHEISFIGGIDAKQVIDNQNSWRLYGYSDNVSTSLPVTYNTSYSKYANLTSSGTIPYTDLIDKLTDEYFSYFANGSYSYLGKYTVSGSGRIDESNLFGVNTNQKRVPLWSTGLSWEISKEGFYKTSWLTYLKLRTTYGYSGNVDKTISAYTTALFLSGSSITGAPYVFIQNPPNPDLRWERIGMLNLGLDFATKNQWLSGSLEYYHKDGKDILGYAPVDPTTGVTQFKGNVAGISGSGIDLSITFQTGKLIKWYSTILYNQATDKVTSYNKTASLSVYIQSSDGTLGTTAINPVIGKPIFSIFSYRWAGLDPNNGDPQGYLNGQISKDYASIGASKNIDDAVFSGSARPTKFGSFRNEFLYKGISLSINITYKLGYFFRRPSINYIDLSASWKGNVDYIRRWTKPGDEVLTNVPSFTYPLNSARENFYKYSEILVENGNHVRLQDIQLSYDIKKLNGNLPLKTLQIYGYISNVGILWKANNAGIDPDYISNNYVNPKTFSLGFRMTF